jgi:hypothetical protein
MSTDPESFVQEQAEAEIEAREYDECVDLDRFDDEDEPRPLDDHEGELEE